MSDHLSLKWGTLKGWNIESEAAAAAFEKWAEMGVCMSAAMEKSGPEQKQALCDLIDVADCAEIYMDWDGKYVSKEDAKAYVIGYGK